MKLHEITVFGTLLTCYIFLFAIGGNLEPGTGTDVIVVLEQVFPPRRAPQLSSSDPNGCRGARLLRITNFDKILMLSDRFFRKIHLPPAAIPTKLVYYKYVLGVYENIGEK